MCVPPWRRLRRPLCGSHALSGMQLGPPTMPLTPRTVMLNLTRDGNVSMVVNSGDGLLACRGSPGLLHSVDIGSARPLTAGDATRAGASRFIGDASRRAVALGPPWASGRGGPVHLLAQEALPCLREVATALGTCGSLATAPPGATAAGLTLMPLRLGSLRCVLADRSPMVSISSSAACAVAATPSPTSPSARLPSLSPSSGRSGGPPLRRRAVAGCPGARGPFTASTRGPMTWLPRRSVTLRRLRRAETNGTPAIGWRRWLNAFGRRRRRPAPVATPWPHRAPCAGGFGARLHRRSLLPH